MKKCHEIIKNIDFNISNHYNLCLKMDCPLTLESSVPDLCLIALSNKSWATSKNLLSETANWFNGQGP